MLQACLNGGRTKREHPDIPVSHAELAEDAVAVSAAGADTLHVHPRNAQGAESLSPGDVGQCLAAIRSSVPQMPVGVGTGAWIAPGHAVRLEHIRGWDVLPDYASVNVNEDDAPETMAILTAKGIGIEAGIWTADDAERFVSVKDDFVCLRILVELTSDNPDEAEWEYGRIVQVLSAAGIDLPLLVHGGGGSVWRMVAVARRDGHHARVGFEDGLMLPDGRTASSNADIVRAARRIMSLA